MSNDLNTSKTKFIFEWVRNNFYGWVIFDFILPIGFRSLGSLEPDTKQVSFYYGVTIMGLLLGASVGSMQWLWLNAKKWQLQAFWWIFVTTLGWGFSALLISSWPSIAHMHSYSTEACLLLVGVVIGTLQAIVWRKSIRKSVLWIAASAFEMLVLGWAVYGVISGPILFKAVLLNTFHSLFVWMPAKVFYFLFIWIILPFLGAITTALPTGFLLYSELHSRSAGMPAEVQSKAAG